MNNDIRTFADDTTLSATGDTEEEAAIKLQPEIVKMNLWAAKWKIQLNPRKTVCLTINRRGGVRKFLNMSGTIVKEVMTHKHLGVTLSHDGKWTDHLNQIIDSAARRLNILRQYYKKFSKNTLLTIYRSFIRPKLEYSSQILSNLNIGEVERLENIQRNGLRIISGTKVGTSHQPLYKEVNLQLLADRRKISRLLKFWEIQKTTKKCQLNRSMITSVEERNPLARRRLKDYSLIKCRTVQYQSSYLPKVITEWNTLALATRESSTKEKFKATITGNKTNVFYWNKETTRSSSILLARIRCDNPDLNANLFGRSMANSPACECGALMETTEHYLFKCRNYDQQRRKILDSPNRLYYNLNRVKYGSELLKGENLENFYNAVQTYILDTQRFA